MKFIFSPTDATMYKESKMLGYRWDLRVLHKDSVPIFEKIFENSLTNYFRKGVRNVNFDFNRIFIRVEKNLSTRVKKEIIFDEI